VQVVTFAAQVASRVCVTRTMDFSAWKKDWEDSRRRENGRHALKVSLLRKLVINSGQLGSVKLSPKLLSKGLGRGLGLEVPEAVVPLVDAEPATLVDVAE
jgi:hypothetical protein